MNIAIVGATGNVGRKILEVLEKKNFPIDNHYRVPRGFLFTYSLIGYVLGETTVPVVKVKGNSDSGLKIISKRPAL